VHQRRTHCHQPTVIRLFEQRIQQILIFLSTRLVALEYTYNTNKLTTTTTTILRPFFLDHPGEPVPEENFWTLWCKGRLIEADTPTIRLGATPSGLTSAPSTNLPIFYTADALPAAQPTVSKHLNIPAI